MCGIVGVAGDVDYNIEKVFTLLLQLDTLRGHHATGVVKVTKSGEIDYEKFSGTPWDFFTKSNKIYTKAGKGSVVGINKLLIGHNRWATQGAHTDENAHPFDTKNIIGVHNGTLDYASFNKIDPDNNYDVDSEALYNFMSDKGIAEAIPEVCGSYSLALYDKNTDQLQLLRNKDRPMCYAHTKNDKTMIFASEPWMIEVACRKNKIDIGQILETKTDHLYFLNLSEAELKKEKATLWFYKKEIKGAEKKPYVVGNYRGVSGNVYTNTYRSGQNLPKSKHTGLDSSSLRTSIKTMVDKDGDIEVYYNGDDNKDSHLNNYLILRTVLKDIPVKMFCLQSLAVVRKEITKSKNTKYLIRPNGYGYVRINSSDTHEVSCVMAQVNSLSSPIDWPFKEVKEELTKDKPKGEVVVFKPKKEEKEEESESGFKWDEINNRYINTGSDLYDGYDWDEEKSQDYLDNRWIRGYNDTELNEVEFHTIMANGCSDCGQNWCELKDVTRVGWISQEEFLCPECNERHLNVKTGKVVH